MNFMDTAYLGGGGGGVYSMLALIQTRMLSLGNIGCIFAEFQYVCSIFSYRTLTIVKTVCFNTLNLALNVLIFFLIFVL